MKMLLLLLTVASDVLVMIVVAIGIWLVAVGEPLWQSSRASFFPELCWVVLAVVGATVALGITTSYRLRPKA
jgi:hypothetical protein